MKKYSQEPYNDRVLTYQLQIDQGYPLYKDNQYFDAQIFLKKYLAVVSPNYRVQQNELYFPQQLQLEP